MGGCSYDVTKSHKIEQASQLVEVGVGLQISPNGTRVLQSVDLEPALKAVVCQAQGKEIRM